MALTKNGKTVKKIFYKGKRVRRVFYKGFLVFVEGFFTKLLGRFSANRIDGYKDFPNPDWYPWEEERVRLAGIVADKQSLYNDAAAAAKPYEDALKKAERDRDSWLSSHPKPDEQRVTQEWTSWDDYRAYLYNILESNVNYLNNTLRKEWDDAVKAYDARVDEVNAAVNAYNTHHANPPSQTIQVETQAWKDWKTTEGQLENAAYAASNKYESLKSQADSAYRAWQTAISEGQPQSVIDSLERTYNDLAGQVLRAGDEKDAAYTALANHRANEPTRYETKPNPEYDKWVEEDARLKAEADRLSAAWNADEPSYAQRITNAEKAYDDFKTNTVDPQTQKYQEWLAKEPSPKYEHNPDYDVWVDTKKTYDDAVSSASSALQPYANAKAQARSALESAQRDYDTHYNAQPPKRIRVSSYYYKYTLSLRFKDLPGPTDVSNDSLKISLKINNPQTEADRQDAGFVDQSRGPNPAYLNDTLSFSRTSTTLTTSWASMEMLYGSAELTITSSEGFKKTYTVYTNKDFITDDFIFRLPE